MAGLNASLSQQKNQILCSTKHAISMLILVFIILFVHCLQFHEYVIVQKADTEGRAWLYCLGPLVQLLQTTFRL